MVILEVGINLDLHNILEIKYYSSPDELISSDLRARFLSALKSFSSETLGEDIGVISLAPYELVCYCKEISLSFDGKEKNVPLLLYAIIEKGTDIEVVKDSLKKLHSIFTNTYTPDEIITQKTDYFKGFQAQIDEIFNKLNLKLEEPIIFRGESKTDNEEIGKQFELNELQSILREDFSGEEQISKLLFSVYAPVSINPNTDFILTIWAYLLEQKVIMNEIASLKGDYAEKAQKGPIPAKVGDIFQIYLVLPEPFEVKENIDTIIWYGEITNATFAVFVPKKIKPKKSYRFFFYFSYYSLNFSEAQIRLMPHL